MFGDMREAIAMNDPEKQYLLCQCLDEILNFVRTFEFHCKKNKNQIYSILLPKIWSQIIDVFLMPTLTAVVKESVLVLQPA